jgi:hypothetical protein
MDEYEIARRATVLPDQFASRLPSKTVGWLRAMERGGEYGELTSELAAALVVAGAAVSASEQQELRALLEATGMPTGPADQLVVHG